MTETVQEPYHYAVIGRAIDHIVAQSPRQASLEDVAASVGMSPAHFQRVFSQWVGVSPKRYQQYLALDHARRLLVERHSVLDTAHATGLSGSGRLHDLFLRWEAMSPGEYARAGEGLEIAWGWFETPFGPALAMGTERGLCGLAFAAESGREAAMADLRARWPRAAFVEAPERLAAWVTRGLRRRRGATAPDRRAVPAQGLGGAARGAERACDDLFRHRGGDRAAEGGARGRDGGGAEPGQLPHSLPPGAAEGGRARRLSLGARGEAGDAGLGVGAARFGGLKKPVPSIR